MKKTIFITGTSSGIGRAAAKQFAANGWNVIGSMRQPEKENELNQLENVLVTSLDVEKTETIQNSIEQGIQRFGKIDVLINNAGIGSFGVFEATPEENIRKLFNTNVFGTMRVIRTMLPYFRKQNAGMIVNVTSSTGLFTIPLLSLYSATKYALEGFSESLYFELAAKKIQVKLIEPGMVETNFDNATMENYAADANQEAYKDYFDKMIKLLSEGQADSQKVTASEAAGVIYNAVTDDTDTFRYVIGQDVKAMIAARSSMSDQEYMEMMWKRFAV